MARAELEFGAEKTTSVIITQADIAISKFDLPTTIMNAGTCRLIEVMESLCQMLLDPLVQSNEMAISVHTEVIRRSPIEAGRKLEVTACYRCQTSPQQGGYYVFVVKACDGEREVGYGVLAYDITDLLNETPKEGPKFNANDYTAGLDTIEEVLKSGEGELVVVGNISEAQALKFTDVGSTMSKKNKNFCCCCS